MSTPTWKELAEMRMFLDSIEFLESPDETASNLNLRSSGWYAKWNIKNSNICIVMTCMCKIELYKRTLTYNSVVILKKVSLEEILSNDDLDKKLRVRLAWLIGQIDNG